MIISDKPTRLLIYIHYNPQGLLSSYVRFMLEKLSPFYQRIVFVSNSPLDTEQKNKISVHADKIIERENKGFDFGAWRDAILQEGWESLREYDYLTLMNDTCFGPICDLTPIFKEMEKKETDYWGITEHTDFKTGFWKFGINIRPHLQSYFMSFNNKIICSQKFQHFWENVKDQKTIQDVIHKYEIGLSTALQKEGFCYRVYLPPKLLTDKINNSAAFLHPYHLIQKGSPFLKVKSFFLFSHPKYLKKVLEQHSDYDYELIEEHITQTFMPNKSMCALDKNKILPDKKPETASNSLKIAIHIHAYNLEGLERYLSYIEKIISRIDIFITTDTDEKKSQIESILKKFNLHSSGIEVIITENRGRDVLPWLKISDKLKKYDVAGHFHVKKTSHAEKWVAQTWMDEIMQSLLEQADQIFSLFNNNQKLGIIIPDIPYYFRTVNRFIVPDDYLEHFFQFWDQLNLTKSLDKESFLRPVMSYGNMFWYRPAALEPLLHYEKFKDDFPQEPLPIKNTTAHGFEEILLYVAWNQNYDFRIIINKEHAFSGFDVENKSGIDRIMNGYTWKIGRAIVWFPQQIRNIFNGIKMKEKEG